MRQELVRDWMTREVITITPETTLPEADQLMAGRQIRRLPVVQDGRLVGIVTATDVRDARPSSVAPLSILEMSAFIAGLPVTEIMTTNLITILQDATIGEAAQLMLVNKIGGLLVVDNEGALVGIITESDIFRMVVNDWIRSQDEPTEPYARYDSESSP